MNIIDMFNGNESLMFAVATIVSFIVVSIVSIWWKSPEKRDKVKKSVFALAMSFLTTAVQVFKSSDNEDPKILWTKVIIITISAWISAQGLHTTKKRSLDVKSILTGD